jgi:phosphoribosylaminoimidazole-succinocarboxamide synthase
MTTALFESSLRSLKFLHRGKVRDIYEVDADRLLIVQTDRLSAFDVILPTAVPGKGEVLTALSLFWFRRLARVIPNHLLDTDPQSGAAERTDAGRAMVVRKLAVADRAIVRGYVAGSGWKVPAHRRDLRDSIAGRVEGG